MTRRIVAALVLFVPFVAALPSCSQAESDVVGRYEVDREALWKEWEPNIALNNPELVEAMRENLPSLRFDLDIESDGTFKSSSIMLAEGLPKETETSIESSGTWTSVGELITLIVTRVNGQSVDGEIPGTLTDGVLRLRLSPRTAVVLRKRRGS